MLDGLAPVAQVALHLGNTDVIAFESDRATWEAAKRDHETPRNRKDDPEENQKRLRGTKIHTKS